MTSELEEYAKKLDEEIIELKDKHQNLKSRLHLLLKSCDKLLSEGKRKDNAVMVSESTFSELRQNVKAVQDSLAEKDKE